MEFRDMSFPKAEKPPGIMCLEKLAHTSRVSISKIQRLLREGHSSGNQQAFGVKSTNQVKRFKICKQGLTHSPSCLSCWHQLFLPASK